MANVEAVKEILEGIASECKFLMRQAVTIHGYNDRPKAQKDTLTGSKLYDTIESRSDGNGLIEILVNDYVDYIQSGRDKGIFPPFDAIQKWAEEKGLPTENNIIWAICQSIYKNGIKPRPFVEIPEAMYGTPNNTDELFFDLTDEYWDDWNKQMCDTVTEELDKQFDKTFKNQK